MAEPQRSHSAVEAVCDAYGVSGREDGDGVQLRRLERFIATSSCVAATDCAPEGTQPVAPSVGAYRPPTVRMGCASIRWLFGRGVARYRLVDMLA